MARSDNEKTRAIADEIMRYLQAQQHAADTLDGIMQWWIARQRVEEAKKNVQRALEYLCDQKLVQKRPLADGKILFYLGKNVVVSATKQN